MDWSRIALELPSEHVIEGKVDASIEVTGRRGRRCTPLRDRLKEKEDTGN